MSPQERGTVVAATRNALLFVSRNSGNSWSHLAFPGQLQGVLHALEIDATRVGTWYAGMEGDQTAGVYRTMDGGASWTRLEGMRGKNIWALAIWESDARVIAAGTDEGIYLTTDRGDSWRRISPQGNTELNPVVSLAFHPADRNTLYAGTLRLPWRTQDGGGTWKSIHTGMLDDSDVFSIRVNAKQPDVVFAGACGGVYRSVDQGGLWARLPTPRDSFRVYNVALDPRQTTTVFAATSAGLLKSSNEGAIWRRVSNHAIKSIAFDPAETSRIYFASTDGGLLVSRDGGETLAAINVGFSNRNLTRMSGARRALYAASIYEPESGGVFRSIDLGVTWARAQGTGMPKEENIRHLAASPDNAKSVFAAGTSRLYRSVDGGQSWNAATALGPDISALLALPGGVVLLGLESGLFRSADGGKSWTPLRLSTGSDRVNVLQSSGVAGTTAITASGVFLSDAKGTYWTPCGPLPDGALAYGLALESGAVALAGTSHALFRSTDGCKSWSPVQGGLEWGTVSIVLFHPSRPGEAFAVQNGKTFRSIDSGMTWKPLGDHGRNGLYPSSLWISPDAPERLLGLFPRRGVMWSMWEPRP
ncbi:MAG: hypothetical protein HYZ37_08445 [Candidatus Solibacter usitatus]|nr:hypothetical protein [Candidatus Solibacter usitatus]